MRRQALHLEEHGDPQHPIVRLVKERIEELSARAESVVDDSAALGVPDPRESSSERSKRS
jgi:hypothetical protein